MAFSINTNKTAAIALQSLNETTRALDETGNRVNTGLQVAGAKDDGAIYSIAQGMRADIESVGVAVKSLARAQGTVDVALAAGEAISDLLIEMKATALAGSDTSITSTSRAAYNADYVSFLEQISVLTQSAEFNGTNLLNGSMNDDSINIEALASYDQAQKLTVAATDFDALIFETNFGATPDTVAIRLGANVTVGNSDTNLASVSTAFDASAATLTYGLGGESQANAVTNEVRTGFTGFYSSTPSGGDPDATNIAAADRAATLAAAVDVIHERLNNELARLGSARKKVELQQVFLQKLEDSYISGVGNLVDANMAKEAARLEALQIKQQLGSQALSIANQMPQVALSLFQ